jgi:hypothetical protein
MDEEEEGEEEMATLAAYIWPERSEVQLYTFDEAPDPRKEIKLRGEPQPGR